LLEKHCYRYQLIERVNEERNDERPWGDLRG
jgi:hypothetical protein